MIDWEGRYAIRGGKELRKGRRHNLSDVDTKMIGVVYVTENTQQDRVLGNPKQDYYEDLAKEVVYVLGNPIQNG
jgi:hypothetical protein